MRKNLKATKRPASSKTEAIKLTYTAYTIPFPTIKSDIGFLVCKKIMFGTDSKQNVNIIKTPAPTRDGIILFLVRTFHANIKTTGITNPKTDICIIKFTIPLEIICHLIIILF